jgi:hypothetical protein
MLRPYFLPLFTLLPGRDVLRIMPSAGPTSRIGGGAVGPVSCPVVLSSTKIRRSDHTVMVSAHRENHSFGDALGGALPV